ncbi:MAG: 3-methyladenine DNA glycosylase [Actinomycetia bacterium]|nr:3-methyladenine DNA glycosylase [Actinomycetes bacterium]
MDLARTLAVLRRGTSDPTVRIRSGSHGTRAVLTARIPEDTGAGLTAVLEQGPHLAPDAAAREAASGPACWPILVRAWGRDPEEVAAFLDRAAALTGLADDWPGFAASPEHRLIPAGIRAAFRTRPGLRLSSSGWIFRHAVSAVFEQKVTGAEAIGAWQRLTREHADPAPSPGRTAPVWARDLVLPLTPLQWRRIPSWHWRTAGVDAPRSAAVGRLAEAAGSLIRVEEARRAAAPVVEGPAPDVAASDTGPAAGGAAHGVAALARGLAAVPGIGPWTVAETMQRSHGLPDAISVGDYHLAHGVCYALEGRAGDDERMLRLLRPWAGNRQRVVRMILAAGPRLPRRGPRVAPQAHRFGG